VQDQDKAIIHSPKQFVHWSDELTDTESTQAVKVIAEVQEKYKNRTNSVENLEELRDEVLYKLMEIGIVAEFDPTPCFYGEPPILEIKGKREMKYGFDHEQKGWEVRRALERGEDYLGQKEQPNSRKATKDDN
jgi:hypothetical protein